MLDLEFSNTSRVAIYILLHAALFQDRSLFGVPYATFMHLLFLNTRKVVELNKKTFSNFIHIVYNGTSNLKDTIQTSQPDHVYTNGSHGLKHENAVSDENSAKKHHSRAQSRDFTPPKIPAKLPPPFYPQHQTPTSANSTSTKPSKMYQTNEQENYDAPADINHPSSTDMVVPNGQADPSKPLPVEASSVGVLMYPPSASGTASSIPRTAIAAQSNVLPGSFPRPGLQHPSALQSFNPQASPFNFGSQVSTRSQSQSSHDFQPPIHPIHHGHTGSIPVPDTPGIALNSQTALALKEYIEIQFGGPSFSDVTVKIIQRSQFAEPIMIKAHRIILARSPKLQELVNLGTDIVVIDLRAKYLETNTFVHVLRYLYGAALPTRNSLAGQPMELSLALAAAGWTCRLPEITAAGLDYANSFMNWDTVEKALAFALEGGLTPFFQFDEADAVLEPTFGDYAGQFLQFILNWLGTNLPSNFQFIASAPQLAESPRLPGTLENRPSVANPRLSRIRFGDLPSEESSQSTTLLSSIMLSLPLGPLKYLLLHPVFLGRPGHADMARAIIMEREIRRKKARESRRYLPGATPYMREAMYWEESFVAAEDNHVQDFTLSRECLKSVIGALGEDGEKRTEEGS
jgi:hypothetical protein